MNTEHIRLAALLGAVCAVSSIVHGDPPQPVQGTPQIRFDARKDPERLLWTDVMPGGAHFDLVRGDLATLLQTGGDFTQATRACLVNDAGDRAFDDADPPAAGGGFWYVVRGVNDAGAGTYDSISTSQVGGRDAEINASPNSCP